MSRNLSPEHSDTDPLLKAVATASGLGRIALGIGLFALPKITMRGLGFADPDSRLLTIAQIAGGRDLVMGAETLLALRAGDEERVRRALTWNALADAGDSVAFSVALVSGDEEAREAGKRGLPMAAVAALGGLIAARRR